MKTTKESAKHRKQLGAAVRQRREAIGVSQEKLAEIIDCHRNYVGLVERGKQNVTVDMLSRIAKSLRCKVSELMKEAGL